MIVSPWSSHLRQTALCKHFQHVTFYICVCQDVLTASLVGLKKHVCFNKLISPVSHPCSVQHKGDLPYGLSQAKEERVYGSPLLKYFSISSSQEKKSYPQQNYVQSCQQQIYCSFCIALIPVFLKQQQKTFYNGITSAFFDPGNTLLKYYILLLKKKTSVMKGTFLSCLLPEWVCHLYYYLLLAIQTMYLILCILYWSDSLGWKLFYIAGCLFVAAQNLEEWEVRHMLWTQKTGSGLCWLQVFVGCWFQQPDNH